MRPISFSYAPTVSSANAIALSQTPVGAIALTLNGALVSGGVATMGAQQKVTIASAANISNRTFAIVGTDRNGNPIGETLTGPNIATVVSVLDYYTVSPITISGTAAGALTVGVNGLGASKPIPLDLYLTPFSVDIAITAFTGTAYKVQYTLDDLYADGYATSTAQTWFDLVTGLTGVATTTLETPATAIRFAITTAASPQSLTARIIQAGVR